MAILPDEIRLAILIAVNVFVFVAAFRFVRRLTSQDRIGLTLNALLLHYLIQYLAVCLPGLLGILTAESMLATAVLFSGALWLIGRPADAAMPARSLSRLDSRFFTGSLLFVGGYFFWMIRIRSSTPTVGDDALTYHLPVVGQWLWTGRISLYNTWFFNPANTYSPLGGSAFMAWLIAPLGVDIVGQFAQIPAMFLTFLAFIQLCRAMGVATSVATIFAAGAMFSHPFISEAILVKDDHFLAAFFAAAIVGCAPDRLTDRLGPWRLGVAIGLFFATKYTAFLTAPFLFLLVDALLRAGWPPRRWLIAAGSVLLIAGPWYIRNWLLTGNPIYPMSVSVAGVELFKGIFVIEHSTQMRTVAGAWKALTQGYGALSPMMVAVLAVGWFLAALSLPRGAIRHPLQRLVLIGAPLGLAIFFCISHAALLRYALPSLLLVFAACALAMRNAVKNEWIQIICAVAISALAMCGGFNDATLVRNLVLCGLISSLLGLSVIVVIEPYLKNRHVRLALVLAAIAILNCVIFVFWHEAVNLSDEVALVSATIFNVEQAPMWKYIHDDLPPAAPMAYTNVVFTRPLMGFNYSRRVFYVPTRPGVRNYHDLPSSRAHVTDEEIRGFVSRLLVENPDHDLWLKNLLNSDAEYLLVGRQPALRDPPERQFAESDPAHFTAVENDEAGTLFQIHR